MENFQEGIIEMENGVRIRFKYVFYPDDLRVKINYLDLANLLRTTGSNNLKEMGIVFGVELLLHDGQNQRVTFCLPEHIMTATANQLENIQ